MKVKRINDTYMAEACSYNPDLEEIELTEEEYFPKSLINAIEIFRLSQAA